VKRISRNPSTLSESLQRHLNAYSIAASAAGMGVFATAHPAEAKIVYTPAHVKIGLGGVELYYLDLNHDHVTDFIIHTFFYAETGAPYGFRILSASSYRTNGSNGEECGGRCTQSASALQRNLQVGSGKRFDRFGGMVTIRYRWVRQNEYDRRLGQCEKPIPRIEVQRQWPDPLWLGAPER
jgi:hypothetical protein